MRVDYKVRSPGTRGGVKTGFSTDSLTDIGSEI